jgi:phage-related protein
VLVVAALVAAAVAIWVFRDQIVAGLQAAMEAIGQWVQGLVQWGEPIRQFWIGLWQGVMEITMGFISWLGSAFSQNILQPIQRALEPVRQLFSTMFQQVQAIASSFFGWWASNLYQMFVEPLDRLLRGLGGLFQQAFSAAGSAIMVGFSTLVRLFNTGVIQPLTTAWTTFVQSLGQAWSAISDAFQSAVVDPIKSAWQGLQDWLAGIVQGAASAVSNAFQSIAGGILGAFRGIIGTVSRIINSIINAINTFIRGVNVVRNAVGLSSFSTIPNVNVEAFAKGGFVKRATLAVVGEGGEPEYIVPESKMAAASANYLTGARGDAVLSAGPSVMAAASPSAVAGGAGGPAQINITTGPVMEFDGRRFATIEDLQSAARQTATQIYATLRTPAGRRAIGVA